MLCRRWGVVNESRAARERSCGSEEVPSEVAAATIQGRSPRQLFWMRFRQDKAALFGLCVVTILILLAVFAGVIAHLIGHGPNEVFQAEMSDDYGIPKGPNSSFWFGADAASRDLFVRVSTAPAPRCSSRLSRRASR